ncbi:MAG: RnfH family protein [Gammaproteobacteria bacterium]|nr:RnfH family protein [Gammaproteobacteria bacterium]
MENAELIDVEVAYARPDAQIILKLRVPQGTTLEQAVRESGILERFPDIDLAKSQLGIFGKLNKAAAELRNGDRVEIYRSLIADPKEVRKQRAAEGKRMKRGGGDIEE